LPEPTILNYKMQHDYNLGEELRPQQRIDEMTDEQDSLNDSGKYTTTSADAIPLASSLDSIGPTNEEEQQITDWNSLVKGESKQQEKQTRDIPEVIISKVSVSSEQEDELKDDEPYISSNSVQELGDLTNNLQELEEKLDQENSQEQETFLSSIESEDDEGKNLIPQPADEPYLIVSDVVTSKSTEELSDLASELKNFEEQINDIVVHDEENDDFSSEEDEIHHYDLQIPESLISTKSTEELSNLVDELHKVEEQLENKLEQSTFLQDES
ncbi:unnamed protein product, partial [Didymodactylos carnosus]